MGLFRSDLPICPANQNCSQWARNYMKYCLCSRKDWISLMLGLISLLSWGMAEIPQIIMNCKQKSSEGLAMGFLFTWVLGDLFNVFGCLLEPATLPTQFYMAVLYLMSTSTLTSQATYYNYFFHGKSKRQAHKIESVHKKQLANGGSLDEESTVPVLSKFTPSLPNPYVDDDNSSHETVYHSFQEPLLGRHALRQLPPASETKNMLCVVFTLTIFLCTYNLKLERNSYPGLDSVKPLNGIVLQVGRKLLQVSGEDTESIGIGTFLGWGMAAIYMGARLPQIFLNFKRRNVQGLNPLMFIFAIVGNSTYVASILVSSMEWSKILPNLPWVVEASGCMMLDTFILAQFIYFRHQKLKRIDSKDGNDRLTAN